MLALLLSTVLMLSQGPLTYADGVAALQQQPGMYLVTYSQVTGDPAKLMVSQPAIVAHDSSGVLSPGIWVSTMIGGRHVGYKLDPDKGETIELLMSRLRLPSPCSTCPNGRCPR